MGIPVTKRQKEVLDFVKTFIDDQGYSPTLEEIKKKSKKADIIVCAGDISIFENKLDKLFVVEV